MIKEILLAAFVGGILGLGITGGYVTLQNKNISAKDNQKAIVTEPTLIPTQSQSLITTDNPTIDSIKIDSPEDDSLISSSKTNINGVTNPNSHIIIATSTQSFIGQSDNQGKFSIPVSLENGLNIIKVSSINQDNIQKDTQINVTYSTAKI
ncbi:MAG: hypothetical protein KIH89_000765 [Candidatus Shapirobacteria bacterium]|nr:hypothetical protein [Candidatus Shapirobacteria bacterium]